MARISRLRNTSPLELDGASRAAAVCRISKPWTRIETTASNVIDEITQVTMTLLGTAISIESPLMSAGLDSIGGTELARELGDRLGVSLPSTLLFDHPSVNTISRSLA